jgi:hypothetical protein
MPLNFDMWDDDEDESLDGGTDLGGGLLGPREIEEEPEPTDLAPYNRGMLGDTISLIGRAGVSTLETLENAAEFFNINDSKVDSASKLRNFDLFKPDIDEYYDKGWLQDTPLGSIPSAAESMGPSLAVAGAGFLAGQVAMPFLPVAGGVIGATLASLGIMGTAEYQSTYETAKAGGLSEDEARSLAWKNGAIEGLGESAGDLIGLSPLMKPLTAMAKKGLKPTLQSLLKADAKSMAKDLFKVYAGEQVTEIGQAVGQTHFLRNAGLTDQTSLEAALQTVIPTMFMTGGFQLGTNTLKAKQRAKLKEALSAKQDPLIRQGAADTVTKMLMGEDGEIASKWETFAKEQIKNGQEISWNQDFEKFSDQLNIAHQKQVAGFISEEEIIGGVVTKEQVDALLNQKRNRGIFDAFERTQGEKIKVTIPEAKDEAGVATQFQERAEEILEEAERKIEEKEKQPVEAEPMSLEEGREAYKEIEEIEKVLENPDISTEVRFRLGERLNSLKTAVALPAEAKVEETKPAEAKPAEPKPAEPVAEVAEPVVEAEPEISPKVQTEIDNRKEEIVFIQEALKKGVSPEARRVLTDRLRVAQDELIALKSPEVAPEMTPPVEEKGFDSALQTKEQVQQVLDKLDEALVEHADKGNQEMVDQLQEAISNYTKLQLDLPSAKELDPEIRKKLNKDFKNIVGKEVVAEQVLEKSESIGAVKITDQAETPLEESQRVVDLPSRVIAWSQDLTVTTGERTSNIIVGYPKGTDVTYYLIRSLEDKGNWIVMKKVPGQRGTVIGAFSATQAKQEGTDARKMAAQFAIDNFKELGTDQWLPDKDAEGKNTWSINVPGGDTQIVLTQMGKNKWLVEEDGNTVQRELDSGKFTDLWSSMSIGQVKEGVEELYGFATTDSASERYAEILAQRNIPSKMGAVTDRLADATVGQIPPGTKPKPKALSTRDFYTLYEPVLTAKQSRETRRAAVGPRTAKRTADYNYIGLEMTDDLRATIKEDIDRLREEYTRTSVQFGDTSQESKAILAGIEDNIQALSRISLIKNGEKIRIKTGVNQAGRTIYAREPRIKPRRELTEKEKAKGFRTSGKARAEKAVKEAGGKPKSKAQQKREDVAQARRFEESLEGAPGEAIPVEERAPVAPPSTGELIREQQPITPQPTDKEREAQGITDEIVRPEVAPFEFQGAREKRQEAIDKAAQEHVAKRDEFVDIMLDRVKKGKGRPPSQDELLYYTAVNEDIYERNNMTPEEIQKVEADIRLTGPSPRAKARGKAAKRQAIIRKQRRLRQGSYIKDYGTPLEQNAWQLLENTDDDPFVRALKQVLTQEELEGIEVIHDPLETTSYYSPEGDYIVLKGNNPFTKVHEVLHAALFYRLRRSPSLQKEVDALMESFREKAEAMGVLNYPTVAYALKNRDEFLSQAGADPVVQMVLESSTKPESKFRNMWEQFVDWARRAIGLPQRFRRELGEALNLITKISQRQRIARMKGMGQYRIVVPAPVKEETAEQRRERVREVQRKSRELSQAQGWLGESYKGIKEWAGQMFKYAGTFVQPINDALYNINPRFAALMRINEAKLSKRNKGQMTELTKLAEAIKGFTDDELSDFKSGWINPDERELLDNLVKEKGFEKEWKYFTNIVKQNERQFLKLGVLSRRQLKENYLPRVVKDPMGLINAMEGTPEGDLFAAQIRQERIRIEKQGGIGAFDKAHQEEFIAKMVLNRRYNAIPRKGFTKARIFDHVPAHLMEYYHDPIESIIDYTHHANELIFQRELVGVSNRNRQLEELFRAEERLDKAKTDEKRAEILREVHEIANDIQDIDTDTRAAVDTMLLEMEDISDLERKQVGDMINARLNQRGTRGAVRSLKNVSLMMTIGNPLSAITQLGDQGFNIMDNGVNGIGGIAKALTGSTLVDNFDIENVLREFSKEGGSSDVLNKLMGWSGLKRMDTLGKESYMQGLMKRIQQGSFEDFEQQFDVYAEFLEGDQSPELKLREAFGSIQEGKPNENGLYMMFSELAKRQPVSLSETSQQFLTAGNARIFWVLKQFALRSLSSAVQDARVGFQEGNGAKGIMKAVGLIALLGLAGAGTDALKDIILGRNLESLPDSVINNIMNLLFLNRYSLERGLDQKKPISTLIANNVMLPPVRAVDDLVVDVWKSAQGDFSYRSMAHIPMFGRIVFDYTPLGEQAEGKRMRAEILDLAERGASQGRLSGLIRQYNKEHADAKVDGLEPITVQTIMTARTQK